MASIFSLCFVFNTDVYKPENLALHILRISSQPQHNLGSSTKNDIQALMSFPYQKKKEKKKKEEEEE